MSKIVVDSAIEVHRTLGGPGLLEAVYEEALVWELRDRGVIAHRQVELPIHYKQRVLGAPLRIDVLVEGLVIVECKSVLQYHPIFEVQTRTYLRQAGLRLGLVINFNEVLVRDGIHRVVHGLTESCISPIQLATK